MPGHHRTLRAATSVALVAFVFVAAAPSAAASPRRVTYQPPADAPVIDPFRAPSSKFGQGNRGIDYATGRGAPVAAAADGQVVYAGNVGGSRHVVILHDDGIRTSYSFLDSIAVRRGQHVRAGDVVGLSAETFHFGARAGDAYLDPLRLLGGGEPEVRLVPDHPRSEAEERRSVWEMLGGLARAAGGVSADAYAWARQNVDDIAAAGLELARTLSPQLEALLSLTPFVIALSIAAGEWWAARETCTPRDAPPPRLRNRRILVRVAGLNSNGRDSSIRRLDAAALGYATDDVVDFSYRGGTTEESDYDARHTHVPIDISGARLEALIRRLQRENPGVPIDIAAHSLGGLVAMDAVGRMGPARPGAPSVGHVVTFGTPHTGAELAGLAVDLRDTLEGRELYRKAAGIQYFPPIDSPVMSDLAPGSEYLRGVPRPPSSVQVTAIAARDDLVIAGHHRREGVDNRMVSVGAVGGLHDHDQLPGAPPALREAALALNGRPATCESLAEAMSDALVSNGAGHVANSLRRRVDAVTELGDPIEMARKLSGRKPTGTVRPRKGPPRSTPTTARR